MFIVANAIMAVGFAGVSAYLHVKNCNGTGWGIGAFLCWLAVILS